MVHSTLAEAKLGSSESLVKWFDFRTLPFLKTVITKRLINVLNKI